MKWLWFYIVTWKHRNDTHLEFFEQYTLVLKAARRCAYDLNHSANDCIVLEARNDMKNLSWIDGKFYYERSKMWQDIFSPTGGKDYRHEMHHKIWELESEVTRLKQVCIDNNIDHKDPNGIPF